MNPCSLNGFLLLNLHVHFSLSHPFKWGRGPIQRGGSMKSAHRVNLKPNACPDCQSNCFDDEILGTDVRQVVELPEMPPEVTQYNIHTCRCSSCGKHVKASVPNEAKYGFGPRLMGFITSLSGEFRLSKRQVVALVGKIGIKICSKCC